MTHTGSDPGGQQGETPARGDARTGSDTGVFWAVTFSNVTAAVLLGWYYHEAFLTG